MLNDYNSEDTEKEKTGGVTYLKGTSIYESSTMYLGY